MDSQPGQAGKAAAQAERADSGLHWAKGPVSAVVCNYNGEGYLPECLKALQAQNGGLDEVLVVDNASTDGSLELLRTSFPEVSVLALKENKGPSVARNAGMRAARNRCVLAIDNDAVLLPDVLDKLRVALAASGTAVAAQPRSVFADEPSRVHYDGAWFHYVGLLSLRNFYSPLDRAEGRGVVPVDGLIAIAILLDRDRVMEVGGYDESLFILFEDYDLSLRLRLAGDTVLSVEEAIVLHKGGTPGISFRSGVAYPKIRAFYHSRNRWVLLVKNHRWRTLLLSMPGMALYELIWGGFSLVQGNFRAHIAGKWALVKLWPELMAERKRIQALRRVPDRELLRGGPLTISPHLLSRRPAALAIGVLDRLLSLWWSLVRPLVG